MRQRDMGLQLRQTWKLPSASPSLLHSGNHRRGFANLVRAKSVACIKANQLKSTLYITAIHGISVYTSCGTRTAMMRCVGTPFSTTKHPMHEIHGCNTHSCNQCSLTSLHFLHSPTGPSRFVKRSCTRARIKIISSTNRPRTRSQRAPERCWSDE